MFRNLLAVALALAGPAALAQGIYSWKDANGGVHYSDLPPPEAKVRTLRQMPLAPASTAKPAATAENPQTYAEKDLAFKKRRAEASEAEEKARKDKAAEDLRQRQCADNRNQLAALEKGHRATRVADNGDFVFLDEDERTAEMERIRQTIERACK